MDHRATNIRLFTYPRPTVAAVNGHAFAGGLITAAVCDYRVAVDEGARFGLNEVPIGIPMPAAYVRMLAHARGDPIATRTSLFRRDLHLGTGARHGHGHQARLPAVALRDIAALADPLDDELPRWFTTDNARHAHSRYWAELKGTPAPW